MGCAASKDAKGSEEKLTVVVNEDEERGTEDDRDDSPSRVQVPISVSPCSRYIMFLLTQCMRPAFHT